MCMLTYLPAGVQPDAAALANGAELNPHGHGYAVVTAQGIIVGKSFDFAESLETFTRLRQEHSGGPALFHSRFRTHGKTSEANIHPFKVNLNSSTVLAHNGILPASVQPTRRQKKSDTRIFAEDCLGKSISDQFDDDATRFVLERWLGPWNKVVVLTVDPRHSKQSYLFNEKAGIWDEGAWYSNSDFQPPVPVARGAFNGVCIACDSMDSADLRGICVVCGSCVECASLPGCCARWCPRIWALPLCEECELPADECECPANADKTVRLALPTSAPVSAVASSPTRLSRRDNAR
ncbi:Glutamine amidotransferases class-II [Amycolatopsis sp. M39]|nr:Glutamine amidotransferases class-II [Amycolatopsis sp. M39]